VSPRASEEEIKRSYRRLASRYHPDVNASADAHQVFVEINEAYEILSDPQQKWRYDQFFLQPETHSHPRQTSSPPQYQAEDKRKRRGRKETSEERIHKAEFVRHRNREFNKRMRTLSFISLAFAFSIFLDHYLPLRNYFDSVKYAFSPEDALMSRNRSISYTIMTGDTPLSLSVKDWGDEHVLLQDQEAYFSETPIWRVLASVQLKNVRFVPDDGLYSLMLMYGLVTLASLFVITYKLENDLFFPAFITFFSNVFVLSFIVLKITN
jgi:curved DNA-binding protein CbpA